MTERYQHQIQSKFRFSLSFSIALILFFDNRLLASSHFFRRYLYFSGLWLLRNALDSRLNGLDTIKRSWFFSMFPNGTFCTAVFNSKQNQMTCIYSSNEGQNVFSFNWLNRYCRFVTVKRCCFSFLSSSLHIINPSIHSHTEGGGVRWECGTNWQWDGWNC